MAYRSFAPTGIAEMLSEINSFAETDLLWASGWDGTTLTLTPKSGEAVFSLWEGTWYASHTGPALRMKMAEGTDTVSSVVSHVAATSSVWLFGGNDPQPWLLIVIMTEPGVYRHAYLGYLDRYGAWTGGAVLDGVSFGHRGGYDPLAWDSEYSHMLFSPSRWDGGVYAEAGPRGGVFVRGAAGASPAVSFVEDTSSYFPDDAPVGGGGYGDYYARALRDPGTAPYSGEAALITIVLFADMLRTGRWAPIGRVPGIRMMHITDYDPGELYSYAGKNWRVFPLCRKAGSPFNTGNLGLAVLEE